VRGKLADISWMYVPDKELGLFNRVSFPSNYSPYVAPAGHCAILAEITYHEGDEVSRMPDQKIIAHVIKSLTNMNIIKEDIVYTALERHSFAYVIYDLDYKKNIAIVKDFCANYGIGLVGRFSEFEYLNMDGCIRNAMNFVRDHT
jgi:protoporphyrinogen oxidase